MAKYKPKLGDEIEFDYNGKTEEGVIEFIASNFVSCYPNTIEFKDSKGDSIKCGVNVQLTNIIKKVKGV